MILAGRSQLEHLEDAAMERDVLVALVQAIQEGELSEDDMDTAIDRFEAAVSHPAGSSLILMPDEWALPAECSADEIADAALGWTPRVLALRVLRWAGIRQGSPLRLVVLEGGSYAGISVVTEKKPADGTTVAVALSGVWLKDGRRATHGFIEGACNMGLLLERVDDPVGTDLTTRYT